MRKYKYYNNPDKANKASNNIGPKDIVVQEKGREISYFVVSNVEEFYNKYINLRPSRRYFNEVISEGWQKFRIDIDGIISRKEINILVSITKDIFLELGYKVHPIVYDIETSYHIVVPGIKLESSGSCHMVINLILDKLLDIKPKVANLIDIGIYKKVQMFRLEGSTKYMQNRWKYVLGEKSIAPLTLFLNGLLSYTLDCIYSVYDDDVVGLALYKKVYVSMSDIKPSVEYTNQGIISKEYNYSKFFKVRKKVGNLIILDRLQPGYCIQCNRVHDNENMYIIGNKSYCWRYINSIKR